MSLSMLLVTMLFMLRVLTPSMLTSSGRFLTKEHEVEEIFRWYELILEMGVPETVSMMTTTATSSCVRFFLLKCIHTPKLIILSTFLWIRKTCHCSIHFLECFTSLRSIVFIWVNLNCLFTVCFLQCIFICILLNTKHLVVIFATQYFWCNLGFFRCKFLRRFLFIWCCLLCSRSFFLLSSFLCLLPLNHVQILEKILSFTSFV